MLIRGGVLDALYFYVLSWTQASAKIARKREFLGLRFREQPASRMRRAGLFSQAAAETVRIFRSTLWEVVPYCLATSG